MKITRIKLSILGFLLVFLAGCSTDPNKRKLSYLHSGEKYFKQNKFQEAVIQFRKLSFGVPGAQVNLDGNYDVGGSKLDFKGHLRLQAKLSQTVTGKKSFFLKAVDPLFRKDGAGTVLPITITGTRDAPTLGVSVFHKTIKRQLGGGDKDNSKDSKDNKNAKPNSNR